MEFESFAILANNIDVFANSENIFLQKKIQNVTLVTFCIGLLSQFCTVQIN